MDLPHILGLAMVLYFVVFSIVDEHRIRTLDDPDREPVTAPPASTPQTRKAEELARNRMDLMKKRKLGHLLLADYRFSSRLTRKDMTSPDSIRKKLDEMFPITRDLVINTDSPVISKLQAMDSMGTKKEECDRLARHIYDQARLAHGSLDSEGIKRFLEYNSELLSKI